jgi:hypothetical protein
MTQPVRRPPKGNPNEVVNQVELWFSVLSRRFLKRGDFASAAEFEQRLTAFLETYNTRHAHPYRWTYTGQPLVRGTPFAQ